MARSIRCCCCSCHYDPHQSIYSIRRVCVCVCVCVCEIQNFLLRMDKNIRFLLIGLASKEIGLLVVGVVVVVCISFFYASIVPNEIPCRFIYTYTYIYIVRVRVRVLYYVIHFPASTVFFRFFGRGRTTIFVVLLLL